MYVGIAVEVVVAWVASADDQMPASAGNASDRGRDMAQDQPANERFPWPLHPQANTHPRSSGRRRDVEVRAARPNGMTQALAVDVEIHEHETHQHLGLDDEVELPDRAVEQSLDRNRRSRIQISVLVVAKPRFQ